MIFLNNIGIAYPDAEGVTEGTIEIMHNRASTNGTLRRYFYGVKYQVTLKWSFLSPADYQTIFNITSTGQQIAYRNSTSGEPGGQLAFYGYVTKGLGHYLAGGSLLREYTITIQQA